MITFVDIDQLSLIIIQKQPGSPSSCSNSPLPQCSVNIITQDQTDNEPILFTTPMPLLRNQVILATPAISVNIIVPLYNPLKFTVFSDY